MTTEEDALLAVAVGADAVGFIFAPSSRQVAVGRVADIVKRLPPDVLTVGVFRDDPVDRIVEVVLKSGVRAVQLHGHEPPGMVRELRCRFSVFIIKAFVAGRPEIGQAPSYGADAVMLDAPSPGSGQVFDWRLADGVPDGVRLILAGGLDSGNVGEAIERVHPWGVDVVSGVEAQPGRKDPQKLREFVQRARASTPPDYKPLGNGPYDWEEELS